MNDTRMSFRGFLGMPSDFQMTITAVSQLSDVKYLFLLSTVIERARAAAAAPADLNASAEDAEKKNNRRLASEIFSNVAGN